LPLIRQHLTRAPALRPSIAAVTVMSWLLSSRPCHADPQWNTGLSFAACQIHRDSPARDALRFCGAARADVLFGRERNRGFGLGPYLEIGTAAFRDVRLSTGVSALLPLQDDFPLVLSAGYSSRQVTEPGLEASIFWGLRSFNYHGAYNMSGGLVLQAQQTFGPRPTRTISLGLRIDGLLLALPFLLLRGALD